MSKSTKLIDRLLTKPKDFTWAELVKVLKQFGYAQVGTGKTGGSRVRFVKEEYPPITLHKPHPKPVLKRYQINDIIDLLKIERLL